MNITGAGTWQQNKSETSKNTKYTEINTIYDDNLGEQILDI